MKSSTIREFVIGLIGVVFGGVFVALTTAYIDKSARLSAIEVSQKQVEELTHKVVELRVQAELAAKQVASSEQLVEEKSRQIEGIVKEILKRKETISRLDIVSALDKKMSEFELIAKQVVDEKLQQSFPRWKVFAGDKYFNSSCMYKFIQKGAMSEGEVDYFTDVNSHWLRVSGTVQQSINNYLSVKNDSPQTLIFSQVRENGMHTIEHDGLLYELCFD